MSFLNIGGWELTVILVLSILLIGPRRMIQVVESIRHLAGQLGEMTRDFTSTLEDEADQASAAGTGQGLAELVKPVTDVQRQLRTTADQTRRAMEGVVKELAAVDDVKKELTEVADEARAAVEPAQEDSVSEAERPTREDPETR